MSNVQSPSTWVIMPVLNNLAMSLDAIGDCLDQTVPTRVLVINQGSDEETRKALEREAELKPDRLFIWSHQPSLPSLSATWNRALEMVWQSGGDKALVINNDVRVSRDTVKGLLYVFDYEPSALFVSAVAVTQDQFERVPELGKLVAGFFTEAKLNKGGPDFSCFMVSQAGHQKYRFDESFIPCYVEDLDMHRRYMLGGDGDKIFSVNLPYLHFASGTLKAMTPEDRQKKEAAINGSRAYYAQKWGGGPNEEKFYRPFENSGVRFFDVEDTYEKDVHVESLKAHVGPTTPDLQRWWQSR